MKEQFVAQKQGRAIALGMALVSAGGLLSTLRADEPAVHSAAAKPTIESVMRDLKSAGEELSKAMPTPGVILDETKRRETAPKAIPAARKMLALARQLSSIDSPGAKARGDDMQA